MQLLKHKIMWFGDADKKLSLVFTDRSYYKVQQNVHMPVTRLINFMLVNGVAREIGSTDFVDRI